MIIFVWCGTSTSEGFRFFFSDTCLLLSCRSLVSCLLSLRLLEDAILTFPFNMLYEQSHRQRIKSGDAFSVMLLFKEGGSFKVDQE